MCGSPPRYCFSFFFWLDLVALWSITLEVDSLADTFAFGLNDQASGTTDNFRVGRVVRMIRLVRLVKLYKITSQRRKEKKMMEDLELLIEQGRMDEGEVENFKFQMTHQKQSKVGTDLVDMITRKVIMMILSMLVLVPLLTFDVTPAHFQHSTELIHNVMAADLQDCATITPAVSTFVDVTNSVGESAELVFSLLDLQVTGDPCGIKAQVVAELKTYITDEDLAEVFVGYKEGMFRDDYISLYTVNRDGFTTTAVFDVSQDAKESALFSIWLTLFVIFILITMSIAFENDAQTLILTPIEQVSSEPRAERVPLTHRWRRHTHTYTHTHRDRA